MRLRPDMILVKSPKPPTVEVDWDALAAYIRFRRAKVARTVQRPAEHCFVSVDFDRSGQVVGVEVVGETQIEIGKILEHAAVRAPNVDFSRVRYVRPQHLEEEPEEEACAAH